MWWFRWHARRFFRSVMNPIRGEAAVKWHFRLRLLYIFIGMNAVMISYKKFVRDRQKLKDEGLVTDETPAHRKARLMQLGDVHIVRSGIGIPTQTYDFNTEEYSRQFQEKTKRLHKDIDSEELKQ